MSQIFDGSLRLPPYLAPKSSVERIQPGARGTWREVSPSPNGSSAAAPVLRLDRPIALLPPARHRRGPMPTPPGALAASQLNPSPST